MGCCFSKVFCKRCWDSSTDTLSKNEDIDDGNGENINEYCVDSDSNDSTSPTTADVGKTEDGNPAVDKGETIESDIESDSDLISSSASVEKENSDEDRDRSVADDGKKVGYFYIDNGRVVNLSRANRKEPEKKIYEPKVIAGRGVPTGRPITAWSRYLEDDEAAITTLALEQKNTAPSDGGKYSYCSWKYLPAIRNQHMFGKMATTVATYTSKRQERPLAAKGPRTHSCFSHSEVANMNIQRTRAPVRPFRQTYFWKPISDEQREILETWERRQTDRDTE